jgi:hypothetical protein
MWEQETPVKHSTEMSEEMYDDGYKNQTNIDISKVVVKQMQEKYGVGPYSTIKCMYLSR